MVIESNQRVSMVAMAASVVGWMGVVAACHPLEDGSTSGPAGDVGGGLDGGMVDADADQATDVPPAEPAELSVSVDDFVFEGVGQGNQREVELSVRNVGGSEVFISRITVSDEVGPNFDELALSSDAPETPVLIESGTFETFPLVYSPADAAADRGQVVVEPLAESVDSVSVPYRSVTQAPDLRAPTILRMGSVPVGESQTKRFDVINRGIESLSLQDMQTPDEPSLSVSYPAGSDPFPVGIDRDGSFGVEVTYTAEDEARLNEQLLIESNDPDDQPFPVTVTANQPEPCLDVNSLELDFGELDEGDEVSETLTMLNCSIDRLLEIDSIAFSTDGGGVFSVEPILGGESFGFPIDIGPGQTFDVRVVADMADRSEARGTLVVRSTDDARSPLLITVKAD